MVGRTISQYRVVEKIGEGGMGVVYRAEDTVLHRPVALKILPPEHAGSDDRTRRFLREARSASALNHPNIVTIYNVVEEDSTVCIVMELVDGASLAETIPPDGLEVRRAIRIAVQVADALAAAHSAGIIHRDIKPGNVMIRSNGTAKVLDFGLAKLDPLIAVDADGPTETLMTRAGVIAGSPMYMSPEQALGSPLDARSDVFSFGAMLYEMLTGDQPFKSTETTSVLHAVVHEREVPVAEVRSDVPPALTTLVAGCLEKNREARIQTMAEIRDSLRRVEAALEAGGSAAGAVPAGTRSRTKAFGRDSFSLRFRSLPVVARIAALVAWVAVVAMVIPDVRQGLGNLLRSATDNSGEGAPATEETEPATAFEFVKQGQALLERSYRAGNIDRAIASFQGALGLEERSAPAYAGLAEAYRLKYKREKDADFLVRARSTIDEAIRLDEHLTEAQVVSARIYLAEGDLDTARRIFEEVLILDPANAGALVGLGQCLVKVGDRESAESVYLQATEIEPDFYRHWETLGIFYYLSGRYAESETAFARSVELAPDLTTSFNNMAAVQHMQGKYAEAASSLQRALEIEPDPRGYNNLGTLYFFQGLYQKAVSALETAVEAGASDYRIWGNLGDAYRWTAGNETRARETFETAVRMVRESITESGIDAEKRALLAEYLAKLGDAEGATRELSGFESDNPYDLFNAAQAAEITGDRERSLTFLEEALRKDLSLEEVRKDPELAALRKDPRYQRLLTRIASQVQPDD